MGKSSKDSTIAKTAEKAATQALMDAGIRYEKDGAVHIDADALKRLRQNKIREATMSRVPSTPKHLQRDAGGAGVSKGHGRWDAMSLRALRKIRDRAPLIQVIHAARRHQVQRMSRRWSGVRGEVGWRVVHRDHLQIDAEPPEAIIPFIKKFERMMEKPSPTYCKTTSELIVQLEEDLLTINRPAVEILYSLYDDTRIVGFRPVDGALIWPTLLWAEKWAQDNHSMVEASLSADYEDEDLLELIENVLDYNLRGTEYCLVREGVLEQVFHRRQLIVAPLNTRTDIDFAGYPPSNVEMALEIILAHINTWDYNTTYFTRGMLAEFIIGISGDVHDDDLDAFADMLREASQGVRKAWQPPIMPTGEGVITKIDLKPSNKEMMFEVWMSLQISLCAAVYRMDPTVINAKPWNAGGGPSMSEGNRHDEIALSQEEGLQGDLGHLCDNIFTPLAQTCHPDLMVIMEYGNFDVGKEAANNEILARVSHTRNEIRLAQGLRPMGFWCEPDQYDDMSDNQKEQYDTNLWNMPTDPTFVNALEQRAQMAAQEEMGGEPGMEGMQPGMEGMEGEEEDPMADDGFGNPVANQAEDNGFGEPEESYPFGKDDGDNQPMRKGRQRRVTVYVEEA